MLKHTPAITILAVSLLAAGCSDSTTDVAAVTGPSSALQLNNAAPFAGIEPRSIAAVAVRGGACPDVHPFRATANLSVRGGDVNLELTEVRMHFVDTFGITAPPITLPAPLLIRQYGTALVQARSSRSFPLDFRFGCGTDRRGTITVHVRTRDGRGRDDAMEIRVSVR